MSKKSITSLLAGLLLSSITQATTVYVSDIQFVAIREGLDNNTRAVERGLKSGTPLDVLEQSNGYTKVRTPSGNEGWIADYFLSDDMVTRDQLVNLQEKLSDASQNKADLTNQLQKDRQDIQDLNRKISSLQSEKESLQQELDKVKELSEKARTIVSQKEDFSYRIESLQQQLDASEAVADKLTKSTEQKWFIIGAATLFGGFILGIIIPLSRRKKASMGSWT